jgi:hypothetical protein
MITVRFPSGFSIQYNSASYVTRRDAYSDLYEKSDGVGWVAQVPNECVIEVKPPCKMYDALKKPPGAILDVAIEFARAKKFEYFDRHKVNELKKLLAFYNAHTGAWK